MSIEKIAHTVTTYASQNIALQNKSAKISTIRLKKGDNKVVFALLPENFHAVRKMTIKRSSIQAVNRVKSILDSGGQVTLERAKEITLQDKLTYLFNQNGITTEADSVVKKLNGSKPSPTEKKFWFLDSIIYKKLKAFAEGIYKHGHSQEEKSNLTAKKIKRLPFFADLDGEFSFRLKTEEGIRKKLIRKYNGGTLDNEVTQHDALHAIGDLFGVRFTIQALTKKQAQSIVNALKKENGENLFKSFDEFQKEVLLYCDNLSEREYDVEQALRALKINQTRGVATKLVEAIREGKMSITEINNFGDDVSSYFTTEQLIDIADARRSQIQTIMKSKIPFRTVHKPTGIDFTKKNKTYKIKPLTVRTKYTPKSNMPTVSIPNSINIQENGAVKQMGYSSLHMNMLHRVPHTTKTFYSEFQIRGSELNDFSEVEHIIYDCFMNKVSSLDENKGQIQKKLLSLTKEQKAEYTKYISQLYRRKRLLEFGIEIEPPIFDKVKTGLDESFSYEGLKKIST